MQLVTRATLIAAVAVISTSMLMQMAVAVEVTGDLAPLPGLGAEITTPIPTGLEQESSKVAAEVTGPTFRPQSPNCFILGSRSFSIPFSVDASGAQPVEVHLFVSRGPAEPWQLLDRKSPQATQKQFQFEADQDGEFWFATRTVDSLGRLHPAGQIESQLKVYVDTTKPQVTFQADADADGRVDLSLSVHDATKVKEMRLRYVTDTMKQWAEVDLGQLSPDGKLQFQPSEAWKQLSIQLVVTDTPGNQSVVHQLLRRPRLAELPDNRYAINPYRSSGEFMALPYRKELGEQVPASTVANPVIKLDRYQAPPPPHVTTANGYSSESVASGSSPSYGFRGAALPASQSPAMKQAPAQVSPSPLTGAASQPTLPPPNSNSGQLPSYGIVPGAGTYGIAAGTSAAGTATVSSPARPNPAVSPSMAAAAPAATNFAPQGQASASVAPSDPPTGPPPPASFMDVLFGTGPPRRYPAQGYPVPSGLSPGAGAPVPGSNPYAFGPPSIRGSQVQPRLVGNVNEALPPPATPEQISNGFNLNSPGQSEPETIPLPGNPQPVGGATGAASGGQPIAGQANEPPQRPRPRTPAEAMRPIDEPSEVSSLLQEEVPTPQGQPDPYRSMRATPGSPPAPTPGPEVASMMERAPIRYSDSERFSLEYELEAVGVQGVEAIELYGSVDGGRTWELWGSDPDRTSPFDIETRNAGSFGFRIVVIGRNGLASPRPMSGETPDIVVVVDTTEPVVRITGARYGEGDRIGSLVIDYECEDANLKARPVSLSFSETPNGPWTTIVAGLRNDGQYVWTADPHLPRQFYLRIDATDEAGNTASYVLDQPIDAQGLAPRARIRGFQSVSGGSPSSGEEGQTANRPRGLFK